MSPVAEQAVADAMQHGAMSGFDALHDCAFDQCCATEGALPAVDYSAGISADEVDGLWRFMAWTLVAFFSALLLAHCAACEAGVCG